MRYASALEAVRQLRPGMRVYVAAMVGTPIALLEALATVDLPDIELVYFLLGGVDVEAMIRRAPHLRHRPLYIGTPLPRQLLGDGFSVMPLSLPQAAAMTRAGRLRFDAALVATTLPSDDGTVGLGPAVGMTMAVLAQPVLAVAEAVPAMPSCRGPRVASSRFAAVVLAERALPAYVHPRDDAAAQRIGRYLARLVADNSTLQIGPGRVANGALRYLTERRGLKIVSDTVYEEVGALAQAGALDADAPIRASFCSGDAQFLARLDGDARFALEDIETVADETALAATPRMTSLTQAFAIDLSGQACCESYGEFLHGGLASQPEFMRGAARAEGGKAVLCLYARDPAGRSAIRVQLAATEPVSVPRSDVHFVVTEYGIAYLHGKSVQDRALELIELAAPEFRDELLAQAREQGLVAHGFRRTNRDAYAVEEERMHLGRDGRSARIRPARLHDVPGLQRLVHRVSKEEIYLRFFRTLRTLSVDEAVRLCAAAPGLDAVYVVVDGPPEAEEVIGNACLFAEPSTGLGEVGYLIDPRWQGAGLGKALQQVLIDKGKAMGLRGLSAQILADNARMLALARASGLKIELERDGETCELVMHW
jgi:acyl-CoA hydrolase/RimJ/RimL family protein N-acetyltransferase